jgi:hypothetical protein
MSPCASRQSVIAPTLGSEIGQVSTATSKVKFMGVPATGEHFSLFSFLYNTFTSSRDISAAPRTYNQTDCCRATHTGDFGIVLAGGIPLERESHEHSLGKIARE